MVTFCIIHIGNRKIFLKHHPSPPLVPTNPLHNICEKLVGTGGGGGGGEIISHSPKCDEPGH